MGRKIVLTGTTLTDLDAPRLVSVDPIESAGSLYLVEPMHPKEQWASGIPANGATVPNLFGDTFAIGDPSVVVAGGINDGVKGKLERSTKGGWHGILSRTATLVTGDGARLTMPTALQTYLQNNPSHAYYLSFWGRLTRAQVTPSDATMLVMMSGASTGNGLPGWYPAGPWLFMTGSTSLGNVNPGNTVGAAFGNAAANGLTVSSGSFPYTGGPMWGAPTGTFGATALTNRNGKWPSFLFYRVYLEDLTVSGRSYADVSQLDQSLYNREVLTAGGRYYGDTYTDPATIP